MSTPTTLVVNKPTTHNIEKLWMIYDTFKPKWNSLTTIQESKPKTQNANQNKLNVKENCIKHQNVYKTQTQCYIISYHNFFFSNHVTWDYIMYIKYLELCSHNNHFQSNFPNLPTIIGM
jgi:hypothetical protein